MKKNIRNLFLKNSAFVRRSLISFGIILLLGAALSYYIDAKITQRIIETEQVSCEQISFNLLLGNLDLNNIEAVQPLENTDQILIKSSKIKIRGMSYWRYLLHSKVYARKIILEDLDVEVVAQEKGENPLPAEAVERKERYSEILIKAFQIKNGRLKARNDRFETFDFESFTTEVKHLQYFPNVDSSNVNWKTIAFEGNDFVMNETNKDHFLSIGKLKLNKNESLDIKNAKLIPKRSKNDFIKPLTYRKSRIDLAIPKLKINRFDAKEIFAEKKFITNKITIEELNFNVFSDQTIPSCPTCIKTYFYEKIGEIDFPINIDSVLVRNSKVTYELQKKLNQPRGKLFWTNIYISIYDISNIEANKKENTTVDIIAKFMGKGNTAVTFLFPNLDATRNYTFAGKVENIDLNEMNPFIGAMTNIKIDKGKLNLLAFNGIGNLHSASGDMEVRYDALELEFFKTYDTKKKILTKIANALIKKDDKSSPENIRTGKMYAERDNKKAFVQNWVETLKSGLYSAILPEIVTSKGLADSDSINKETIKNNIKTNIKEKIQRFKRDKK